MTLARWLIAGSWLLLFWLLAATVWAPAIQRQLTATAQTLVAAEPTGYAPVEVHFEGQHAILRGRVRTASARQAAEAAVREGLRTASASAAGLDRHLNPVTSVTNEIEVAPFPPGWLVLAAQGRSGRLIGTAASEFEARDAVARVRERWVAEGGTLEAKVAADPSRFDESPHAETTLTSVPVPRTAGDDTAQIQIARFGGPWRRLAAETADTALQAEVASLGVTSSEWETGLLPAIQAARKYSQAERARLALQRQQAELPPPHVLLAARDHRLLLVGETATLAIKRSLLNSVIATFPDWKVVDELRVNPKRRGEGEFGPITTALLPQDDTKSPQKSFMLGLSGRGWKALDWEVARDARPWLDALPKDLPPDLLARDSTIAIEWLQGDFRGIPTLPIRAQPSFLTLTLLPDRAILAGQVAEESNRSQLVEAVREIYGSHAVIMAEGLLARGTCEPAPEVQQTLRSLPPLPAGNDSITVAFARPGQVWKSLPATPELLEAGGMVKANLVPADFPAPMAEDTFAEGFDYIRAAWARRSPPAASAQTSR